MHRRKYKWKVRILLKYNRVVVTGLKGGGYVTKFMIESISAHPNFSPSTTFTMNILSAGNEPISIDTSLSLTSTSYSIASVVYTNQTLMYTLVASVISDVYFQTEDQTFSITENNEVQLSPSLPCSHLGSTSITYSIGDYNGRAVPSWISIDPNTGLLTIISQNLSSDTQIDFQIISTSSGIDTQKVIRLSILDWVVSNWLKCNKLSNSICLLWNSGYVLSNNNCITNSSSTSANSTQINSIIEPSETSKSIKTTTQSILASTAGITAAFSVVNTSSLSSLWAMVNQVQLCFLLLLTRSHVPIDVKTIITGITVAINFPNLLNFNSIGIYNSVIEKFDFDLSNPTLDLLDVKTDSTIYNISSAILFILLIIPLHLIISLISKLFNNTNSEGEWIRLKSIFKVVINKILLMLTFGWYIRYMLEMNQYILISSLHEIINFHSSNTLKVVSLVFSILILCLCISIIVFVLYLSLSSYEAIEESHNKLGEFFNGIKMQKKFKLYSSILLIRRFVFIILLLSLVSIKSWMLVGILSIIQFFYVIWIIVLRPFSETKGNIIEIINELFFIVLLGSLVYLNSEENWNATNTSIYVWIITSNNLVAFIIVLGTFQHLIFSWYS